MDIEIRSDEEEPTKSDLEFIVTSDDEEEEEEYVEESEMNGKDEARELLAGLSTEERANVIRYYNGRPKRERKKTNFFTQSIQTDIKDLYLQEDPEYVHDCTSDSGTEQEDDQSDYQPGSCSSSDESSE